MWLPAAPHTPPLPPPEWSPPAMGRISDIRPSTEEPGNMGETGRFQRTARSQFRQTITRRRSLSVPGSSAHCKRHHHTPRAEGSARHASVGAAPTSAWTGSPQWVSGGRDLRPSAGRTAQQMWAAPRTRPLPAPMTPVKSCRRLCRCLVFAKTVSGDVRTGLMNRKVRGPPRMC